MKMLNNIYGASGPRIAEAKMFFSHIWFAKLLWTLRKNAEVSFELWSKNPDQEQGWDL